MRHKRVKVGRVYKFMPVTFDILNPPFGAVSGDIVTVIELRGCPKVNTMGMCHIAKNGRFSGMVCTNSLQDI